MACDFGVRTLLGETDIGRQYDIVTVDMTDLDALKQTVEGTDTGLIWMESPSNPQIKITDIEAVVEIAAAAGAYTVMDNTAATRCCRIPSH